MAAKGWSITPPFFGEGNTFEDYVANEPGASPYAMAILMGLQAKPVYQGTVDPVTVTERRAANRHARRARSGNTAAIARQARRNRQLNRAGRGFGPVRRANRIWLPGITPPVDAEVVDA